MRRLPPGPSQVFNEINADNWSSLDKLRECVGKQVWAGAGRSAPSAPALWHSLHARCRQPCMWLRLRQACALQAVGMSASQTAWRPQHAWSVSS